MFRVPLWIFHGNSKCADLFQPQFKGRKPNKEDQSCPLCQPQQDRRSRPFQALTTEHGGNMWYGRVTANIAFSAICAVNCALAITERVSVTLARWSGCGGHTLQTMSATSKHHTSSSEELRVDVVVSN